MIFPFVTVRRNGKTILPAALFEVDENFTFEHLLYQADSEYVSGENVKVEIQVKGTNTWHNVVSGIYGSLKLCRREEQNVSHIKFTIQDEYSKSSSSIVPSTSNVFNEMMSAASKKALPNPKPTTNRNDHLYNDFLALLRSNNLGWEYGTQNIAGKLFVNKLTSLLYYLDDKHQTLKLRSLKIPTFFLQLPLYQQNTYYKKGSHHKTTLKRKELEFYADKLEECVLEPWASKLCWDQVVTASLELCSVARTYANYLETVNQHMQRIQLASAPARSPESNSNLEIRSSCTENAIEEIYLPIAKHIRDASEYEIISLEEFLPDIKEKRFFYLSNLTIDSTIMLYRYHHGNYLGTLNFIWKIPEDFELRDDTKNAQAIIRTQSLLPQFFTRYMRRHIFAKYSLITKITPSVLRYLYHDLVGDSSAVDNSYSAEVDKRVRIMLELGDPEICIDMHKNNGFKGTKFDEFWNEMESYFSENLLSVHERRHSNILYLLSFVSVRDLRESIIEQLENKRNEHPLSDNCLVPSDRWISYQFCPKNNWYKASTQYTGRFQIKYMYRQFTCLIFADDKHKVPIGEEVPTSTGVRNKKTATLKETELSVMKCNRHDCKVCKKVRMPYDDFQSLSFIPDPEPIYGKPTSEKFRPSAMNITVDDEISEKRPGQFVNTKIRRTITCEYCAKMRCIYSNVALTNDEEIKLQATLDGLYYSCGSQLLPEDHELSEQLSIRLNLTCDSPIESTYFSWRLKRFDICYWCGESKNLIEPSDTLKGEWKTIYPLCSFCKNNGKTWYKRAPKKFNQLSSNEHNDDTWGKMSKKNLERDRDNDDNDWLNPGQRQNMLDQM
ncbi:42298_t:CDS:2 [Gigaspora margarita]|uniref:42298_t:CDS:1 n=1 Tax=Gigaspora margarita TaxID=4874 RepID=A0ABN7UFB6_GIGMA|nr:42298_t:CDS:2 [Gigaspora margarita]